MTDKICILFCRCGGWAATPNEFNNISEALHKIDAHVFEINDMCAFSINDKDVLQSINTSYKQKVIIACYPRAVKGIFSQTDTTFDNYSVISFKETPENSIIEKLFNDFGIKNGKADYRIINTALAVPAWFPVVDQTLCTACGQCARFCLFGVYKLEKGKLTVVNPLSCKNKCPACGRTCPSSAIMFPRLEEKTPLAGAEPGQKNEQDIGKNSNLFVMLNERNRKNKNIFAENIMQLAEEERKKALDELKKDSLKNKQ